MEVCFNGRVALVTGASRGIGRAAAIALAEAGADVAVCYKSGAFEASETVAAIQRLGRKAKSYAAAIEDYEANRRLIDSVIEDFGSLGVLVCNAGIPPGGLPVCDCSPVEFEQVMRVNALGPFSLIQLAIPHLREQRRSDVIVVSSVATRNLRPNTVAYSMSKAALEALAQVLAKEERQHGIRCNIVAPGLTDTEMGSGGAKRIYGVQNIRELDGTQPYGHVCTPQEVAAAMVYLASAANPYVNGQRLYVDGGG